jgi:hypothetical protein
MAIEKAVKLNTENKGKGLTLIKDLAMNDANSSVRAAALNFIANNGEASDVEVACIDRIDKDQSYMVVSTALKNLGKTNPEKAMMKAQKLENEKSSKMIAGVAQLYGSHGKKENFAFFQTSLKGKYLQGFEQLGVMNSLTYFISRQDIDVISEAYDLYDFLNNSGGYYTKMFLPQNIEYVNSVIDAKIGEANEELLAHEKNNDALYADQVRKKLKILNDLNAKYKALAEKVSAE